MIAITKVDGINCIRNSAKQVSRASSRRSHTLSEAMIPHTRDYLPPKESLSRSSRITRDKFVLDYSFATYAHHHTGSAPAVSSLPDLSDTTHLDMSPKGRASGTRSDTFSIRNGDDAMLVSPTLIGVADGVSGWSDKTSGGVCNAGEWSRYLLETMGRKIINYKNKSFSSRSLNKREINECLDDSYLHTTNLMEINHMKGSSTILLAMIFGRRLNMVSIGDSKLYIIRNGELIATNQEQMLSPLCPNQIGTNSLNKLPSKIAWFNSIEVENDDLIIMASDGLSDNLWEQDIVSYSCEKMRKRKNPKISSESEIANYLLYKAKDVAFDNFAVCPYVQKLNSIPSSSSNFIVGGKVDDISICVARVLEKV